MNNHHDTLRTGQYCLTRVQRNTHQSINKLSTCGQYAQCHLPVDGDRSHHVTTNYLARNHRRSARAAARSAPTLRVLRRQWLHRDPVCRPYDARVRPARSRWTPVHAPHDGTPIGRRVRSVCSRISQPIFSPAVVHRRFYALAPSNGTGTEPGVLRHSKLLVALLHRQNKARGADHPVRRSPCRHGERLSPWLRALTERKGQGRRSLVGQGN